MTFSLVLAAAEEHVPQALVMPIWAFPAIAAVFFIVAGVITFTYRDVANRHSHKTGGAPEHDAHGGHGH